MDYWEEKNMEGNIGNAEMLDERRINLRNKNSRITELEEKSLKLKEDERITYADNREI